MDTWILAGTIGLILALAVSAVFSLAETALSSLSPARVETLVKDERPGSRRLAKVMAHRAEHINLLVLLRTLCEVTATALMAAVFVEAFGLHVWSLIAAIVLTALINFVVIGVLSRTLGRQNPYSISLAAAPFLLGVNRVFGFLARGLVRAGSVLSPGRGFRDGPFASEIELREMVDIATEHGIVETDERRMIQSVFDLTNTTARAVMVPRTEMVWIEDTKSAGQATSLCVRSGLSRLPVIGEDVDDIVGIVYLKDLVAQTYHDQDAGRHTPVTEVMRKPNFVPDSRLLTDLLEDMQRDQVHLTILVDEYGAVAGLISIEDILEEIVGEISDEYDADEDLPIEDLGDGRYRVSSRLSLSELEELFREQRYEGGHHDEQRDSSRGEPGNGEVAREERGGEGSWEDRSWVPERATEIEFSEEQHDQADTVAGLGALELGKVPMPGAEITTAGLHLVFEGGHNKRGRYIVKSAVVSRVAPGEDQPAEDGAAAAGQSGSAEATPLRDDSAPRPAVGQNGEGD